MIKNKKTNVGLLRERIERNYEDYKKGMECFGADMEVLFLFAPEIVAVCEIRSYLLDDYYVNENEAAFLLKIDEPLKKLADEWEYHKHICGDFKEFLSDYIDGVFTRDNYSATVADELREKYGGDIPLNTACLLELVEMGHKLFGMVETAAEEMERIFDDYEDDDDEGADI